MKNWEVSWGNIDSEKLKKLLNEGWEPFCVLAGEYGETVYVKRQQATGGKR